MNIIIPVLERVVGELGRTTKTLLEYEEKDGPILERIQGLRAIAKRLDDRQEELFVNATDDFCPKLDDVQWVDHLLNEGKPVMVKLGGYMTAD